MLEFSLPVPNTATFDVAGFECGKAALNEFLIEHALDKQNARLSRTYVATVENRVVAFYTLAHVAIQQTKAPNALGRGMPRTMPAILMARFAVDLQFQGRGLGRSMFTDAIRRTWAVMESGAAPVRFFVVDAMDEDARSFYERYNMIASPENRMRLFLSYKTIRSAFQEG